MVQSHNTVGRQLFNNQKVGCLKWIFIQIFILSPYRNTRFMQATRNISSDAKRHEHSIE
jgi:hypothetical protein